MIINDNIYWNQLFSSSSSRTDRWSHFQQNAGLRLFVHPWIMYDIDDCYKFTRTFWGFSAAVFIQAVLERVYCSAAYNFTWLGNGLELF